MGLRTETLVLSCSQEIESLSVELETLCSRFGEVTRITPCASQSVGLRRSGNCITVVFEAAEDATSAMMNINGMMVGDRFVRAEILAAAIDNDTTRVRTVKRSRS